MKIFFSILLAVLIFSGFSLNAYNEICCMFSASRYYGWPFPYFVLNKSVETYAEAERLKTDSTFALIESGWQFNFSTHMTQGVLGSPVLSLLADVMISIVLGFVLVFGLSRVRKAVSQ